MPVIHTMVGDVEVAAETNWGDQDDYCRQAKAELEPSSNIRVVIRVRPPNERELALPGGVCVKVDGPNKQVTVTGRPPFTYDIALSLEVTQEQAFEKVGLEIVQTAYNGYNASMFAYGQTSSGKSFSMMGVRGTALVGLIPRIAHLLFYVIAKTPERQFFVEASFLEICKFYRHTYLDYSTPNKFSYNLIFNDSRQ